MSFEEVYTRDPSMFPDLRKYSKVSQMDTRLAQLKGFIKTHKKESNRLTRWKREYNYLSVKRILYLPPDTPMPPLVLLKRFALEIQDSHNASDPEGKKETCKILWELIDTIIQLVPVYRSKLYPTG